MLKALGIIVALIFGTTAVVALTYKNTFNGLQRLDEAATGKEREIASCYQKRADMLPNLEAVVAKYASHEKDVFTQTAAARASAGKVVLPENATEEQVKAFSETLKTSGSAFTRLLATAENYPNLKADTSFLLLQKNLKDVEQQCAFTRKNYIEAVRLYNTSVRSFPGNFISGLHSMKTRTQITFDDEKANTKTPKLFTK
jgi:LemA protein